MSSLFRTDIITNILNCSLDEMIKAAVETSATLKASPDKSDSTHCAFMTRHGRPIFQYYAENGEHATRFAKAMAGYRKSMPYPSVTLYRVGSDYFTTVENSAVELRDSYSWAQVDGLVVDIGGGSGHVAMVLARVSF